MNDFQERVVTENEELQVKISALHAFISRNVIFTKLEPIERDLLVSQLRAMRMYQKILGQRIARFV